MEVHYTTNVLNVMGFGAAGDGKKDDSQAVQSAFDSVKGGETVYFPAGKYLITKTINISTNNINIAGHGRSSHLIYSYGQKDRDNAATASLLAFAEGIRDITVKDLKLEYTGYFYPNVGETYKGKVNGLNFAQCFDVNIENVEIFGFNASGISISTGSPEKYAKRFKADKCYLHHNRVAGVAFGYVEQISITNCDLEYQGSVLDGGTGYGCTGASYEIPRYIQIIGNRAMYNYRKGIDLHAGINAVIEGNICHGNRLYGIYAEGPNTGNIIIKGNIVSGMKRDSLGIPPPYTWINGIDVGCYSKKPVMEGYYNYIIEGNQIYDFGLDEGSAYPINIYPDFKKGIVQIRNNTFRTGKITKLVNFSSEGKHDSSDIKMDILGNQAFIDECTDKMLDIPYYSDINITGNQITVDKANKTNKPFNIGKNYRFVTCANNNVEISNAEEFTELLSEISEKGRSKVYKAGNILNGKLEE